jgi:hypothetical protein
MSLYPAPEVNGFYGHMNSKTHEKESWSPDLFSVY